MKRILFTTVFAILTSVRCIAADTITLNITGAAIPQVLPIYHEMSGLKLIVASNVRRVSADITVDHPHDDPITKSQAMKLIERALIQQAGIVITKLDDKSASVTYNDALKIVTRKLPRQKE